MNREELIDKIINALDLYTTKELEELWQDLYAN